MKPVQSSSSQYLLYFAWLVAVVATLGSLYFSEVLGYVPCELCWYQRIFMYPLSIILGIAAYHGERTIKKYVLPLSIIGGIISLYHYMVQKVPGFEEIKPCTNGVPCNVDYIDWLGFITIPFLALIAFVLITVSLLFVKQAEKEEDQELEQGLEQE
ncbi:disulfide oxidoreductase [Cohnella sp. WQ 127256]|uniref:disulfide oxidoreductase n=1 Tax=Cohnella sp. WQ 127256 TaxID=2938790 RepID=UPI0021196545|nr:disulfide oxidoreductase [Cohnella sp. WQ 127256]